MNNYSTTEELKQQIFVALEEKGLLPKEHQNYISCICPKCNKHDAFTYIDAGFYSWLICNHRNNCGYREQLKTFLGIQFPQREVPKDYRLAFEKHGLTMEGLTFIIGSSKEPSLLISRNGEGYEYRKQLKWKKDDQKYRWMNPKGFTKDKGTNTRKDSRRFIGRKG